MVKTNSKNKLVGSGSGFVYKVDDKYNYIITNHHVIKSGDGFKVVNYNFNNLKLLNFIFKYYYLYLLDFLCFNKRLL